MYYANKPVDKGDKFVESWEINEDNYDEELVQKIEAEANSKAEDLKTEILNAKDLLNYYFFLMLARE